MKRGCVGVTTGGFADEGLVDELLESAHVPAAALD